MRNEKDRRCELSRKTKETDVRISLDIDGDGESRVKLPDEFLRHMIETLARYAKFDLEIDSEGDIEHHLTEDVAITLGRALREAIGERPVRRVSSAVVPMDEALVLVTVDLVDRPYINVEVPDIMYEHFLRSFVMESRATLHSQIIRGQDDHHMIEATFKALGLCLGDATRLEEKIVSTKSKVEWSRK